jgi:hypothetical protein
MGVPGLAGEPGRAAGDAGAYCGVRGGGVVGPPGVMEAAADPVTMMLALGPTDMVEAAGSMTDAPTSTTTVLAPGPWMPAADRRGSPWGPVVVGDCTGAQQPHMDTTTQEQQAPKKTAT